MRGRRCGNRNASVVPARSLTPPALDGRLQKLEFSGTTAYVQLTYDAAGRLWALKDTRLPVADFGTSNTFYYEYDDNNRPTIITYPDGETIVYTYDAARLSHIDDRPLPLRLRASAGDPLNLLKISNTFRSVYNWER